MLRTHLALAPLHRPAQTVGRMHQSLGSAVSRCQAKFALVSPYFDRTVEGQSFSLQSGFLSAPRLQHRRPPPRRPPAIPRPILSRHPHPIPRPPPPTGVIKRVTGTYRYYLTRAGRAAIAAGRSLTQLTIIPALAQ